MTSMLTGTPACRPDRGKDRGLKVKARAKDEVLKAKARTKRLMLKAKADQGTDAHDLSQNQALKAMSVLV